MCGAGGVPLVDAIPEPESRPTRLLLGRAERTEEESGERLGKPTALAMLSSDARSSIAYASEAVTPAARPPLD
jgi:hypothetical protein